MAILSVVAYHVFPDQFPGGFLGVDVFFVISGFLISTIIFKGLARNGFSFSEFYAHRIRRIFPALILVVIFCFLIGWHALMPSEFILLGKHIVASLGFYENFVLRSEAGYFDMATALKPLMHVWSLAVEEQFYLIFPLLVWGAWRLRLSILTLILLIFAISFAAYLRDILHNSIAAFFSPKSRFWELMAGAILAQLSLNHAALLQRLRTLGGGSRASRETAAAWVSVAGLLLLGWAVFASDRYVPGVNLTRQTFAVASGTLLIFSGRFAWVNRFLLANRLVVYVGLISYPLYLWHWPLLSFLTIVDGKYPSPQQRLVAVLLSVALAVLTFHFVEQPIRRRSGHRREKTLGLVAVATSLLLLGLAAKQIAPDYDEQTAKIMQVWDFHGYPIPAALYLDPDYGFTALGKNDGNKIAVIGDSHALQYENTVDALFKRADADSARLPEVIFLNDAMSPEFTIGPPLYDKVITDKAVTTVVFSEFWAFRQNSDKIDYAVRCCGDGLMQTMGGNAPTPLSPHQIDEMNGNLAAMITALRQAGKTVYLILDNPFGEELAPRSLLQRSWFRRPKIVPSSLPRAAAIERDEPARSRLQQIAQDTGAKLIDPAQQLCDQTQCPALSADGTPIYKDYDHLSLYTLTSRVRYLDFILQPPAASE